MKKIEQVLKATVGVTDTVKPLLRTELSMALYQIAKEHSEMASQVEGKDENAELRHSLVAILLAYTTLEAYINTYGKDRLKANKWEEKFLNPKVSVESKWRGIPRRVTGKSLNMGNEPFKSFGELEGLRHYIVHFNPKFTAPVVTKKGGVSEAKTKLNADKAKWACDVAKRMIVELHRLDGSEPPQWAQ